MLARVYTCAVIGLDGVVVEVEVDDTQGFPGMTVVGLPDVAVQESRERVQAAVRQFCGFDGTGQALIKTAMSQLQLSARAYHRILKLARTIADLAGSASIQPQHVAEVLQYRPSLLMG